MAPPGKKRKLKRVKVQAEQGNTQLSTEEENDSVAVTRPMERSATEEEFPAMQQNELVIIEETEELKADEELEQLMAGIFEEEMEFLKSEQMRRERWEQMTLYAILAELGWTFAEVNKTFQGDRSISSNLFIKKKIIEGWKRTDGKPEIRTSIDSQGFLVVEAWTFSLAIKKAIEVGLKWDRGQVFRWVRPHKDFEPQLQTNFNLYELRTTPTQLEIEYKKAKEFSPPFIGSIYQFKANYNGSFSVYKSKVVKNTFAAYKGQLPEKVFTPFVKRGLVKDPKTGANLRGIPYTKDDPVIKDHPELRAISEEAIIKNVPFNVRLDIQKQSEDGWYFVKTEFGEEGYMAKHLVETDLPNNDKEVRYYLVQKDDTALGIARKFYSQKSKDNVGPVQGMGEDFRDYVVKLAQVNAGRGMKFPTSNLEEEDAWKGVQVFEGLRVWIPSAAGMYDLIESTPSGNLHGQRWVKDSLQTVLNVSPNALMIHAFLDEWRKIPRDQREAKVQEYALMGSDFIKKLRFNSPAWLDVMLLYAQPQLYVSKSLFTLMREFVIGYLDRMASLDPAILVNNLERFLTNLTKVDYYVGLFQGTIEGIKGWFVDLWDMIVGMVEIAGELINIRKNVERLGKLGEFIMKAVDYIKSGEGNFLEFMKNFNPLDLLGAAEQLLAVGGYKLGTFLAEKVISFTGQSPVGVGHDIGILIGYLIPEILLAVFSGTISLAMKAVVQGFRTIFMRIIRPLLEGFKIVVSAIKEALSMIRVLIGHVEKFIAATATKMKDSKLGQMIKEMLEGLEQFLKGKVDEAAEGIVTKGDDVVEGGSHADDLKSANKEKYGKEAAEDAEKGGVKKDDPDYNDKLEVLVEAKAATDIADAATVSPHPSILIHTILNPILARYPKLKEKNVHFEARFTGPHHWSMWMIGSEIEYDNDYDSNEKGPDKENISNEKNENEVGNEKEKSEIERNLEEPELTYSENTMDKLKKHSQDMREAARKIGIELPKSPGKLETEIAMKEYITKIVKEGDKKTGVYMTLGDVRWYKLGDGIVIRRLDGEFVTFLNYSRGRAAQQWDKIL
jgi:hypothetical protein